MRVGGFIVVLAALTGLCCQNANAQAGVRIKDLGRLEGWRDNALVGYGIVTGLSGSGDSPRNEVTQQTLRNVLGRLGVNVTPDQISSRNVAAVAITAVIPAAARAGDRLDVSISSIGDARSLVGGTLLMAPLRGANEKTYALAQGAVAVGGHEFESNLNSVSRNYPASGVITGGATMEVSVASDVVRDGGKLNFVLRDPDFTTASRVAAAINAALGANVAAVEDANAISINASGARAEIFKTIERVEALTILPDESARVIVNERSGVVVAGGGVRISSVVVSQGDIRVSVTTENDASQPYDIIGANPRISSLIVTNTKIAVDPSRDVVASFPNTSVADLMTGLSKLKVDTRGKIAVLQALKAAGALHADLVVQ
jgi:flagellar P-ring protein precursor FlgI